LIEKAVQEGKDEGYGHVRMIGNGDILTHYEARRRIQESSVDSVMVGRGALIKPWIFKEFHENKTWIPNAKERIEVYRTLASYMKDHFGDDDFGRKRAFGFLPWHFEFLSRYTPHPEEKFGILSTEKSLIQDRVTISPDDLSPLEVLLSNQHNHVHSIIASLLWDSNSDANALQKLSEFAESREFAEIMLNGGTDKVEDTVLTNLPKSKAGKWGKRKVRNPGPKRSEEEIIQIRAERAAKKATILAEGGVWPPLKGVTDRQKGKDI